MLLRPALVCVAAAATAAAAGGRPRPPYRAWGFAWQIAEHARSLYAGTNS